MLALNNISVINIGDKFVKAVQSDQANAQGGTIDDTGVTNIPNMGSYITRIVQLKYIKPSLMMPIIQPFARLQNSIFPMDDNGILVIRDYAENVKRMLEMISRIDVSVPAEFINEVIPIRYAKVDDIANALNSARRRRRRNGKHWRRRQQPADQRVVRQRTARHSGSAAWCIGGGLGGTGTSGSSVTATAGLLAATPAQHQWHAFRRVVHVCTAFEQHHQQSVRFRQRSESNPIVRRDQNHSQRKQQFVARVCHAAGHG